MDKLICAKLTCQEIVKEGISCIDCKGIYHRKCEGVKRGEGQQGYICKQCEIKKRICGEESITEVQSVSEVSMVRLTGVEDILRSEIESLKKELASLKEIIRILIEEKEQDTTQPKEKVAKEGELEWTVCTTKSRRVKRMSADFTNLKNKFEVLA